MKIPLVGPDVEQAIGYMLRLTFLHNFIPFVLGLACLGTLIWLIARPSRVKIFLLMGFGLLLLDFEYMKHPMEPLKSQTLVTLATETPRYTFQWFVEKMITKGLPLLLLCGGLTCISGSIL